MRACCSKWGVLSDPPFVGVVFGTMTLTCGMSYRYLLDDPRLVPYLVAACASPLVVALLVTVALLGARRGIVAWLAGLPFDVGNVNGLLNGVAGKLQVRFVDKAPPRDDFNEELERIETTVFAMGYGDDEPTVDVALGVVDSKLSLARSNYRRYLRVRAIVDEVLVPMHRNYPISNVWVC